MIDDDHMYNVFVSNLLNKNINDNEIYFETEGIKSQSNNETVYAELKLDNLSENDVTNAGISQFGFGIYNTKDAKFVKKFRFKSTRRSDREKFILGR